DPNIEVLIGVIHTLHLCFGDAQQLALESFPLALANVGENKDDVATLKIITFLVFLVLYMPNPVGDPTAVISEQVGSGDLGLPDGLWIATIVVNCHTGVFFFDL
ncbi:hypothetical protein ACJX0J_021639, partial [Zea mays]